jgi:hypothetical protein
VFFAAAQMHSNLRDFYLTQGRHCSFFEWIEGYSRWIGQNGGQMVAYNPTPRPLAMQAATHEAPGQSHHEIARTNLLVLVMNMMATLVVFAGILALMVTNMSAAAGVGLHGVSSNASRAMFSAVVAEADSSRSAPSIIPSGSYCRLQRRRSLPAMPRSTGAPSRGRHRARI